MDIALAILCGLLYFAGTNRVGYTLASALGSGVFIGFVLGLYFGDVTKGLAIGASIQLVYLGIIMTGGNVPADAALAAVIAIPIALKTGIDTDAAVALAVPFGVLGVFLDQIRRTTNSIWVRMGDKYALMGDRKGIFKCAFLYPELMTILLRFVPVFVLTLFGTDAVSSLLKVLPGWAITGFSVAGGILPAMGFAIIIVTIGKPKLLPYFFIGFFAVQYLGINTMAAAVFGVCISLLVIFNSMKKEEA
ncbi:PTS mannose/fructose/sorbose/N-acetylgalactosamine transporter subunit IIC [Faecalicoccus pleomorphus]|uniref:PTS sugar transporter subunit IIC n=1 Tax=Faecalicoccus pleomorphus TaxID=1323 RepID=A0AAW6CUC6_9FIRM|nr:PTS sugar transporter subunit IIC [Faecalicoccus pleomorphus]MDB7980704.1 PTS sugar transporter subunit IIC [Faecalicoccus pleomorphus]MDB7982911.1 PTS sugar transporter subunit IIC [Faecalicoccus pleomorphus]